MSELKVNTINPSSGTSLQFPVATQVVVGNTGNSTVLVVSSATAENLGSINADYHVYTTDGVVKSVYGWKSNSQSEALGTVSAHPLNLITSNTERMRIDSNGNIGVGISTPEHLVHIYGSNPSLNIQNTASPAGSGGSIIFGHQQNVGQAGATAAIGKISAYLTNGGAAGSRAGHLQFFTSLEGTLSEKLRITNSGNVWIYSGTGGGVPTSIDPMYGLRLEGNVANTSTSSISYASGGGGGAALTFYRDGGYGTGIVLSTNATTTLTPNATSERMRIDPNGNIGIGDTSPTVKVDLGNYFINSASPTGAEQTSHIRLYKSGENRYGFGISTNALNIAANQSGASIRLYTNSLERMRIDSSGNVGVGTSTPGATFDVVGVTRSTSFVGNGTIPIGGIIMWSGTIASIPSGWALCNGSNGTPDLRDKFIVGATADSSGAKTNITGSLTQTGGSKDTIVVEHTHGLTAPAPVTPTSTNQVVGGVKVSNGGVNTSSVGLDQSVGELNIQTAWTIPLTNYSVITSGVTGTNANLPPYFALAFIMRTV